MPYSLKNLDLLTATVCLLGALPASMVLADGKVFAPRSYKGSIEERSQEAIIIFHRGQKGPRNEPLRDGALEHLILKIQVAGKTDKAAAESFGWVVPFPKEPKVEREDAALFKECFDYVEARLARRRPSKGIDAKGEKSAVATNEAEDVEVLSRKVVGSYDVAIVRQSRDGGLNAWLDAEGFQRAAGGDAVIDRYAKKDFVFACMKVQDAALEAGKPLDLHPLRFTFRTGGIDGIYFPMMLTGLQEEPFDVNLYVFYDKWLNDKLSPYGYVHRGFQLRYRDWDTRECEANAGKSWSAPKTDSFLGSLAHRVPQLSRLFRKLHPGKKYYLTNLRARRLEPRDVRQWPGDLWLFPYYTDKRFVPFDAREGGPASSVYAEP